MPDFTIHNVQVRHVPIFDPRGNAHQVTRVSMFVGENGPFIEDFGKGTKREDTPDSIQMWQTEVVNKLRSLPGI